MDIELKIINIPPEQISPTIRDLKSVFTTPASRQDQILEQLQLYLQQQAHTPLKSAAIDTHPSSFADELLNPSTRSLPTIADERPTLPESTATSDSPDSNSSQVKMSRIDRWLSNDRIFVGLLTLALISGYFIYTRQSPLTWIRSLIEHHAPAKPQK